MHGAAAAEPRRVKPAGGRVSKAQAQGLKASGEETREKLIQTRYRLYLEAKPPLNHKQRVHQHKFVQQWSNQPKHVQ